MQYQGKDRGWAVKLDFIGANRAVRPEGLDKQPAVFSYFRGTRTDWKAGLSTFAKVVYRDLWPGIDLVYNGTVHKLKYEFIVAPGADPSRIRLHYRGATSVGLTDAGGLQVDTPEGSFEDASPVAWQEIDGRRVPVEMAYSLSDDGRFGFSIGRYDPARPLVLDPAVIVYCGYIGGGGQDVATDVAVDGSGNAYVVGRTTSSESTFPETVGPDLTFNSATTQADVFVAKVDATGTKLISCGYIGGNDLDKALGVAVDGSENVYVVGETRSNERSFRVRVGPDTSHNGGPPGQFPIDAFVAKIALLDDLTVSGTPRPGGTVSLNLAAIEARGLPYQLATSFNSGLIPVDTRSIGLGIDELCLISVSGLLSHVFQGYAGGLDNHGKATARIVIPDEARLIGVKTCSAFVTLDSSWPSGIRSTSETRVIDIVK